MGRKSDPYLRFHVQRVADGALAELVARQHGVVGLDQLLELGLSARAAQLRADAGRLHRIHHSVYSVMPLTLLGRNGRYMAAVLACGPSAAISHRSAAALLELRSTSRANIDVTIPQRSPRKHERLDIHRSTTLAPEDVAPKNGIPCTTVARTLLDIAQVITRRQLERALDQAEILQLLDIEALLDQIERNKARPAAKRLRAVLDEHYIGSTPTWSELEELLLAGCRRRDLPIPEINGLVDPHDGDPNVLRVDFVWREHRVIVETDGYRTHSTRQAQEEDRWRDQRLQAAGWVVMRITWRQLTRNPDEVLERLARLLRRRQHAASGL